MRVVVSGGGTGGHIYPALAIARALARRFPGVEAVYVGTRRGLEADIVPRAGLRFATITARGVVGKSPLAALGGGAALVRGAVESLGLLRRLRPRLVVGTGGYVSLPVVLAARLLGIPAAVQEQNVVPGWANRVLSGLGAEAFLPCEEARRYLPPWARARVTGNPVRPEVLEARREEAAPRLGLDPRGFTLVVFGGSRGAESLNRAMVGALPYLARRPGLQVVYVTGRMHHRAALTDLGGMAKAGIAQQRPGKIRVEPYLYNLEDALAAADLVVCRAGAMALAEITARGLPAVLVPSPHVAYNHQVKNALQLARRGAAVVIAEHELGPERLLRELEGLMDDPKRLQAMARASRGLGRPQALDEIVSRLGELGRLRSSPAAG
ncbi:MAG: undecaprenyldiphospho-muramoylpentapeptide beta-N-acetylglucosaminyltransferase [Acetobacteraceae bacterium]|nr:undecaprenyldiphospho-muramoylpentapeptide beta-N-acetylglucosaminyltransferase [Acetobacteraceae bacterium]